MSPLKAQSSNWGVVFTARIDRNVFLVSLPIASHPKPVGPPRARGCKERVRPTFGHIEPCATYPRQNRRPAAHHYVLSWVPPENPYGKPREPTIYPSMMSNGGLWCTPRNAWGVLRGLTMSRQLYILARGIYRGIPSYDF